MYMYNFLGKHVLTTLLTRKLKQGEVIVKTLILFLFTAVKNTGHTHARTRVPQTFTRKGGSSAASSIVVVVIVAVISLVVGFDDDVVVVILIFANALFDLENFLEERLKQWRTL